MKNAFTLIEIIIVIALFSAVVLITVPLSQSNLNSSELDTALLVSVSSIRTAQSYARSGMNDSVWGVRFDGNRVIVFKGDSFSERDIEYDIETIFSSKITFTGLSEIVFSKIKGDPSVTGTIFIDTLDRGESIEVNSLGALDY